MTTKGKIIEFIRAKGVIKTKEITLKFGVSRQYASVLVSDFLVKKELIKIGSTRNAFYVTKKYAQEHSEVLPREFSKQYKKEGLEEHQVLLEMEERLPFISDLSENVRSIFTFAFSEMLNNAIEHSQSKNISTKVSVEGNRLLSFEISDAGIGVFRHIMRKRALRSETEAVQDLLKGKTSTMPQSHSGEGIFFTSKLADVFILESFDHELTIRHFLRKEKEVDFRQIRSKKRGTWVYFSIPLNSRLHLKNVFERYTNLTSDSDHGFDKTEIEVKLFAESGVSISRSQARRILAGLNKFKIIVLDYEKVPLVGQAFADEIYRVFQKAHPSIVIQNKNMSAGVRFMVERAKTEAKRK